LEISKSTPPWNPTLQKTNGGAPGWYGNPLEQGHV